MATTIRPLVYKTNYDKWAAIEAEISDDEEEQARKNLKAQKEGMTDQELRRLHDSWHEPEVKAMLTHEHLARVNSKVAGTPEAQTIKLVKAEEHPAFRPTDKEPTNDASRARVPKGDRAQKTPRKGAEAADAAATARAFKGGKPFPEASPAPKQATAHAGSDGTHRGKSAAPPPGAPAAPPPAPKYDLLATLQGLLQTEGVDAQASAVAQLLHLIDASEGLEAQDLGAKARDFGALAPLLELLAHERTQQGALRALGNLASTAFDASADETKARLHELGAFARVLPLVHSTDELTHMYALGAVQNLCTRPEYARDVQAAGADARVRELAEASPNEAVRHYASNCLANMRTVLDPDVGKLIRVIDRRGEGDGAVDMWVEHAAEAPTWRPLGEARAKAADDAAALSSRTARSSA